MTPRKNISKLGFALATVAFLLFQILAPSPSLEGQKVNMGHSLFSGAVVCGAYVVGYVIELALKKK